MRRALRAVLLGTRSAWSSARWIEGAGLVVLSRGVEDVDRATAGREQLAAAATRWAGRVLRVLARLPGGRWRATCLYRSVAACLVRRELELAHRLAFGVREDASLPTGVAAHAWTIGDGTDSWHPLARPGRR